MISILKISQNKQYVTKELETGKRKLSDDYLQVILCGRLENPLVNCPKQIMNESLN